MVNNTFYLVPGPSGSRKRDEDKPKPGPSGFGRKDEDGGDFSASSSDWIPSDDDFLSSDAEEEMTVKQIRMQSNQIKNTRNGSVEKSSVASNRQRSSHSLPGHPRVINVNRRALGIVTQTISTLITLMNSSSFTPQPQKESKSRNFNKSINVHEEPNKSVDNVLISKHRYKNVTMKPKRKNEKKVRREEADKGIMIPIGSGTTSVSERKFNKVNWKSFTTATRSLLRALFKRSELATRSLTGKPSPAFQHRKPKERLDKRKIADLIWEITNRFDVSARRVRSIITTKCADECKMLRTRQKNGKPIEDSEESE